MYMLGCEMTFVCPALVCSFSFQTPCIDFDWPTAEMHRNIPSTTKIDVRLIMLFLLSLLCEARELYFIARAESNWEQHAVRRLSLIADSATVVVRFVRRYDKAQKAAENKTVGGGGKLIRSAV